MVVGFELSSKFLLLLNFLFQFVSQVINWFCLTVKHFIQMFNQLRFYFDFLSCKVLFLSCFLDFKHTFLEVRAKLRGKMIDNLHNRSLCILFDKNKILFEKTFKSQIFLFESYQCCRKMSLQLIKSSFYFRISCR